MIEGFAIPSRAGRGRQSPAWCRRGGLVGVGTSVLHGREHEVEAVEVLVRDMTTIVVASQNVSPELAVAARDAGAVGLLDAGLVPDLTRLEADCRALKAAHQADPDGDEKQGGLIVAPLGEGHYVYTGLAFFRQLPAGVPGAYRLFANLLALGGEEEDE